jgi:HAD superfamily hydrolase (TIGR01549 family)
MPPDQPFDAISFDCFGTLVDVDPPPDVAAAVADALAALGVDVPDDWATVYTEPHLDLSEGAELPLHEHVEAVLAGRGRDVHLETAEAAVLDAFDREVRTREGAPRAVEAAADRGPVGVLSNCTVPGLVERTLADAALDDHLDAVVTSVGCGWRKPDERAFEAAADALDVAPADLLHVGDDPDADGGVEAAGGRYWPVDDRPLAALATDLEGDAWA